MQEQLRILSERDISVNIHSTDFPYVDPVQVESFNRWYRDCPSIHLKAGGINLHVRPKYFNKEACSSAGYRFLLRCEQAEAGIWLERKLLSRLVDTLYEDIDFDALSRLDQSLILEFLFSQALEQFEEYFSASVSVEPYNEQLETTPTEILTAEVSIQNTDISSLLCFEIPLEFSDFWGQFLKQNSPEEIPENSYYEEEIIVPLSLTYKSVEIDLRSLRGLDFGDVILLGSENVIQSTYELCVGDKQIWRATELAGQDAVKVTGALQNTLQAVNMVDYNKEKSIMSDGIEQAAIDDISVALSFEVGRKDVSVKQLRELQEGAIISFPEDDRKEVQIVINGKEVGWGTLVRVGEDVGVKIERIFVNG